MPVAAGVCLLIGLLLIPSLRGALRRLLGLAGRSLAALGALAALRAAGGAAVGLGLGVNLFNALTVGLLGLPGAGLLLLLNWATRL